MPKDFLALDTGFPSFTGQETVGQKVDQLYSYTYMLLENLRYCLRNLDAGNFNETGLKEITSPIYAEIRDAEGNLAQLALTAQSLAARLNDAEGNVTSLQATAQGLSSRVSNAEGQVSIVRQTVDGLTIYNPQTGQTLINGGMIATGTVVASRLMGSYVYLLDQAGNVVGAIYIADTTTGDGLEFFTQYGGIRFRPAGNFWVNSGNGSFGTNEYGFSVQADLYPAPDAARSLGLGEYRWAQIYAASGTIVTSDRSAKNSISYDMDRYEALFDGLRPVSCKYNAGTSGRLHVAYIAQDVEVAVEAAGLTSKDFAGLIKSPRKDGGVDYSLRYGEFVPLNTMKIQRLEARVARLERSVAHG